jgi:hypothetical protein
MKTIYCTTFSEVGFQEYAQEFLESFLLFSDLDLILVLDEDINDLPVNSRIKVITNKYSNQIQNSYKDLKKTDDYRFQPNRFSYKTSCVKLSYDYAKNNNFEFLIWIDADSLIKKQSFDNVIKSLLPEDNHIASFFDRDSSYGYSETGIVCFNILHPDTEKFIYDWNDIMVSGDILKYSEWHDAFLFSHLVRARPHDTFKYLCRSLNLKSSHPIFEYNKTREVVEHLKGKIRKKLGFNPERYYVSMKFFNLYDKIAKIIRKKS